MITALIGSLLANGLPMLADKLMGKAEDKALDFIEDKTGIDFSVVHEDDMDTAVGQHLKALTELDVEMKALMIEERGQELDSEQKLIEAHLEDIQDARHSNVDLQNSQAGWLAKNTSFLLDFVLVFSFIGAVLLAFFVDIPNESKDLLYIMIGGLAHHVSSIVGFHRGSSQGSKDKTQEIVNTKGN